MNRERSSRRSQDSRAIRASSEAIYRAFLDPDALEIWQAPGDMTGKVHEFDRRVGGGYIMSLFYPASEQVHPGKTAEREDRFAVRFLELSPPERIVQTVNFDSVDPAFSGEMTMAVTLQQVEAGTKVTIAFDNIPGGIRPEDNSAGTRSSLEKLAGYVE